MREQGCELFPYTCFREEGLTVLQFLRLHHYEWLRWSAESLVGVFGYMIYRLPHKQYSLYYALIASGILLGLFMRMRNRPDHRTRLSTFLMLASSGITVLLHFWQSYARDYQPQGRYIITVVLLISFVTAYGLDQLNVLFRTPGEGRIGLSPATVFTLVWLLLLVWAWFGTMTKMVL